MLLGARETVLLVVIDSTTPVGSCVGRGRLYPPRHRFSFPARFFTYVPSTPIIASNKAKFASVMSAGY